MASSSATLLIPPSSSSSTATTTTATTATIQHMASAATRPVSAAVHPTPSNATARRQQRASHSVASSTQQHTAPHEDSNSPYTDVYSHPAVVAYMAAHPRRTIPRFGPYLLLQTLGEGEFGKVKLGIHVQWGEEVAVKLIRRGNVDNAVRLSKVEREIEVLRTLKHPNIVRLYDVIETDKYIGIILEYASGGELFDHILAHRYLKEKDAAKLFSQLISGVWYIHQKKIVHRDLKLENLLLDRQRNVIITDFGFANRFEHKADDLMQTSCGSPCYAAPELVISEGLYVGSAVDIWSCGVILYAMLAGYLPFDDDPANPDGDNINLLYKYIVSTPLSFPDYISADARDLLSMMLVPDPIRRANLDGVMRHRWLSAHAGTSRTDGIPNAFGRSVEELERAALDQHQQRRLAYQRQMRAAAMASQPPSSHRSNHGREATHSGVPTRSRSTQPEYLYESSADQSMLQSTSSPGRTTLPATPNPNGSVSGKKPTYGSPSAHGITSDDPFAPPVQQATSLAGAVTTSRAAEEQPAGKTPANGNLAPTETKNQSPKGHKSNNSGGAGGFRHTIQVEYDEPKGGRRSDERRTGRSSTDQQQHSLPAPGQSPNKDRRVSGNNSTKPLPTPVSTTTTTTTSSPPRSTQQPSSRIPTATRAATLSPPAPQHDIPTLSVSTPATPDTTTRSIPSDTKERDKEDGSQTSGTSSYKKGHKKGRSSVDKFSFVKIFSGGSATPTPANPVLDNLTSPVPITSRAPSEASSLLNPSPDKSKEKEKEKEGKKSRRNTLTVMVEPLSRTIRGKSKNRGATTPGPISADPSNTSASSLAPPPPLPPNSKIPQSAAAMTTTPTTAEPFSMESDVSADTSERNNMSASTSKARKVMAWFRTKSKGRDSMGIGGGGAELEADEQQQQAQNSSSVQLTLTTPTATTTKITTVPQTPVAPGPPKRSASTATESSFSTPNFVQKFRNSVTVGGSAQKDHSHSSAAASKSQNPHGQLRIHHGAVDQTTITTKAPPEVMKHVKEILEGMGVEISVESSYKYRCVRAKKRKGVVGVQATQIGAGAAGGGAGAGGQKEGGDLAAFTMLGSAASNGVDKRGLPIPSQTSFGATGNMLRGLLMRRQSSQVSTSSSSHPQPLSFDDENSVVISPSTPTGDGIPPHGGSGPLVMMQETAYGDPSQDAGDEVRFSVELTRLDRLTDTFSLDIRRLKGNLRSYKFLYDTIRRRADLQRLDQ